jgi:hypothetical protein
MDERHPHIHLGNRDNLVYNHRLINYKDTKTKCRHLKKVTCEGTSRQVFIRVYRHSQSCWYFRPSFVNYCPSNLLSSSPFLPFPVSKYSIYRQCVAGKGVLSCVGDHILQELKTLYLTRFRTYKIARPPQTKTLGDRGPQTDKNLPQLPLQANCFR